MKVLKAKTSHPKKTIFQIKDLYYVKHNIALKDIVDGKEMLDPVEVIRHSISDKPRLGVNGTPYIEKEFSVLRGSRRITAALKKGFTHIEGVIVNEV